MLPLRPNVCILLLNKNDELFLGERNGEKGIWQFPQGGVEPEFTLEQNVIKEASEELGVEEKFFQVIKQLKHTHQYEFRTPPDYAKDRWRGQSQTFWLVRFLGEDSNINLAKNTPEFMNFMWCAPNKASQYVDPIRLPGYLTAIDECISYIEKGA